MVSFVLRLLALLACLLCSIDGAAVGRKGTISQKDIQAALENAASLLQRYDLTLAEKQLNVILEAVPTDHEALQLYGTYILQSGGDPQKAVEYFEKAIHYSQGVVKQQTHVYINYLEALRQAKQYAKALQVGQEVLTTSLQEVVPSPDMGSIYLNLGILYSDFGDHQKSYEMFTTCVRVHNKNEGCWYRLLELLIRSQNYLEAEEQGKIAMGILPKSCLVHYYVGVSLHFQKKVDEALALYFYAEHLDPSVLSVKSNIAAALQGLGRVEEAEAAYRRLIPLMPNDAGLLNNFGSLLGIQGKREEEVYWLMKALEVDAHMEQAIMNMAGYYQDEGLLDDAKLYLRRFTNLPDVNKDMLDLRLATMLSPVCVSWSQMVAERSHMIQQLQSIIQNPAPVMKAELDSAYDRIHFYLSYHGLNDRFIQELVVQAYGRYVTEIGMIVPGIEKSSIQSFLQHESKSNRELMKTTIPTQSKGVIRIMGLPSTHTTSASMSSSGTSGGSSTEMSTTSMNTSNNKKRVGFCSKFFGVFEPHGMLLDGAMKYLPRHQFSVICLAVARTDGKPLASTVAQSCDEVHDISLVFQHAVDFITKLNLDVLVFADLVSEPMNHFLSQVRFAPIQMAFWGNPITSGAPTIDYFISAEIMEHPHRTRISRQDDPYTEQVLLTEGQGVWYFRPMDPEVELAKVNLTGKVAKPVSYTRQDFGLEDDWCVFLLPQSIFKIHPLFDYVLREILIRNPTCHLVITAGRRALWTKIYLDRLQSVFVEDDDKIRNKMTGHYHNNHNNQASLRSSTLMSRLHVIERVSSESFYNLLTLSDVILHPFPFDGSRTSADALMMGKPFVTLPTEYLRGRMGMTYYRTMNIPELVARDIEEYIEIVSFLVRDRSFYQQVVEKIKNRLDLIWEDMMFPFSLTCILQRVLGLPFLSSATHDDVHSNSNKNFSGMARSDAFVTFLKGTGRNVDDELQRSLQREENSREFDRVFLSKRQSWQLDQSGRATMESVISDANRWPLLFEHWRRTALHGRRLPAQPDHTYVTNATLRGFDIVKIVEEKVKSEHIISPKDKQGHRNQNMKKSPQSITTKEPTAVKQATTTTFDNAIEKPSADKTIEFKLPTGLKLSVGTGASLTGKSSPSADQQTNRDLPRKASHHVSPDASQQSSSSSPMKNIAAVSDSTPFTSGSKSISLPTHDDPIMMRFQTLVRYREFAEAQKLAHQLFAKYQQDPIFLMELGVLQFFRGEYQEAFTLCQQAIRLSKEPLIEMIVCLGVSATYLPHESQTSIDAFLEAHNMMLPSVTNPLTGEIDRKVIPVNSFFSVNLETIESNLIASYETSRRYDECIEAAEVIYEIPMTSTIGAYVVAFATVNWSTRSIPHLQSIENRIKRGMSRRNESFNTFGSPSSLHELIMKFRRHGDSALNHIIPCYSQSPEYHDMFVEASKSLLQIIALLEQDRYWLTSSSSVTTAQDSMSLGQKSEFIVSPNNLYPSQWETARMNAEQNIETTSAGVTLITQFFDPAEKLHLSESSRKTLQDDLNMVLTRNLMNPYIEEICMLLEKEFDFSKFPNNHKIKKYLLGKRLTFRDAFLFANDYIPGRTVVLANADIYLDTSVRRLFSLSGKPLLPHNILISLLKWVEMDGVLSIPIRTDSQDIWIFRSPLGGDKANSQEMRALIEEGSDFYFGLPRCDNRLAYLFSETAQAKTLNMTVSNPVFHIHGIEIQRTSRPMGALYGMKGAVQGTGKNILIAETLPF